MPLGEIHADRRFRARPRCVSPSARSCVRAPVRAVVRDPARGAGLAATSCELVIADINQAPGQRRRRLPPPVLHVF
jgi:hypothetical protein